MQSRPVLAVLVALAAFPGLVAPAGATDRPIDGAQLVIKRSGTREKLVFVSKDPSFLFPPIGSMDDPATGSPGGAIVDVFSHTEGSASLTMPPGAGSPGWKVKDGTVDSYRFTNAAAPGGVSPVRSATVKQGRRLKIVARAAGLPLARPQESVGIRISFGSLRSCARFDPSTVRRDDPGAFVARGALASAVGDCSDAALSAMTCTDMRFPTCDGPCPGAAVCALSPNLNDCICVSPDQPCGTTATVCNGQCPAGEGCATFAGYPAPTCACIPTGSVPCGGRWPICGGACPGSTVCRPYPEPSPAYGCVCTNPGPCDAACGGLDCPSGSFCLRQSDMDCTCISLP